jgi:hypothetical protein
MNRAEYRRRRRAYRDATHHLALAQGDRAYGYGQPAASHALRELEAARAAFPQPPRALSFGWAMRDRRHCVERSIKRLRYAETLWPEVEGDPRGQQRLTASIEHHRRVVRAYLKPLKEGYPKCAN